MVMNYIKILLRLHLGASDGSQLGTLIHMNKKLHQSNINADATNVAACFNCVKDPFEACVLAL